MKVFLIVAILSSLMLGGCAAGTGYYPMYGESELERTNAATTQMFQNQAALDAMQLNTMAISNAAIAETVNHR